MLRRFSPLAVGLCVVLSLPAIAQEQTQQPSYGKDQQKDPQARPAYNPDQQKDPATRPSPAIVPPPVVAPKPTQKEPFTARNQYGPPATVRKVDFLGSVYIPVDSWIYPAMLRLYSFGFLDRAFINLRPWTRRSAINLLADSEQDIASSDNDEAKAILQALLHEFAPEINANHYENGAVNGIYSAYTRVTAISGPVLRDSFHLGQTFANDYARPYQTGFNNITGFSTISEFGRFSLHFRGEFQRAPSADGYTFALAQTLSTIDQIYVYAAPNRPSDVIPEGPLKSTGTFRIQEASIAVHLAKHEISFGKSDAWLGPGVGGALAWSNNAENPYAFRINRVEPMYIPFIRNVLGPLRYDFFVGPLQGHTYPNSPWVHTTAFTFEPTKDFQFGFSRMAIWGGKDHTPITLHTFIKSFFHFQDTNGNEKFSRSDPGARFSSFSFSYRLPFPRRLVTLYADTFVHDDVTPISAPHRAAWRPGIYIASLPGAPKLDLRIEGVSTDPPVPQSNAGQHIYFETVQRNGYTNKGFVMGDWMGREGKGGQAWLTWHLSGNEAVQLQYARKKNAKDFIFGGTTQNDLIVNVVKRFGPQWELNATFQHEWWKAPIYKTGQQTNNTAQFQITYYPRLLEGIGSR